MKKIVQVVSSLLIVTMFTCLQSQAQLKLIHYWSFDNTMPCAGTGGTNLSPITPDYSSIGGATLVYDNSQTTPTSCDCATRDSIIDNGTPGDTTSSNLFPSYWTDTCSGGQNNFVRCRNPSNNMSFLWHLPTTGYQNIALTYATQTSSTTHGQLYQLLDYSLDGGSTFTNAGLAFDTVTMANYTSFGTIQVNLSSITAVNNNANFVFRIQFSGLINDTIGSGNNRFDNIRLQGDSLVTGINEITANHGYSIYPNPANDVLNITSTIDGDKVISIFNVVGQLVWSFISSDRQIPLNISQFSSGIYCLNIRETNGASNYTTKFVKN